MLAALEERLAREPRAVRDLVELVEQDIRGFAVDRLFRFIYLPFNTFLVLSRAQDRFRMLERVREHLAPSGAFAFDFFTPDPKRLIEEPEWVTEVEIDGEDPRGAGIVHVLRERKRTFNLLEQYMHVDWRHRITQGDEVLAEWEDELDIGYVFPNELALILERQGFRIKARYGGPDLRPYAPTLADMQPMYVVAQVAP
jgi:hypothetical protein